MRRLLTLGLLSAATGLSAMMGCDCGEFTAGVEALYWKPVHCPIPYAHSQIESTDPDEHQYYLLKGDYDWGVRVRVGYEKDCLFTDLAYHWVEATDSAFKERQDDFDDFNLPGSTANGLQVTEADARLRTRYQGLDWRFGCQGCVGCGQLAFFGDVRWSDLRLHAETEGPDLQTPEDILFVDQSLRYRAGGLGGGLQFDCPLFCGLGISSRFGATAMIGEVSQPTYAVQDAGDVEAVIPSTSYSAVVPLLDVRLALTYTGCFCDTEWTATVGYELDYFVDVLPYWTTVEGVRNIPVTDCHSFGFGGIFFGIHAGF